MKNIPRIEKVYVLNNYLLDLTFSNGDQRKYDVEPLLGKPSFEALKNPKFFRQVSIEPGGYAVSWNNDIDISEYELWKNGE